MPKNKKALKKLLKLLSDHPEIVERVNVTIKPREIAKNDSKLKQSPDKRK